MSRQSDLSKSNEEHIGSSTSIKDCQLIDFQIFKRNSAVLAAASLENEIPWNVKRIFFIECNSAEIRGDHAHILCSQLFVRTAGNVVINCWDGSREVSFHLNSMNQALLVPPGIWVKLIMSELSSVSVLTDRQYEQSDYLKNTEEFIMFKAIK